MTDSHWNLLVWVAAIVFIGLPLYVGTFVGTVKFWEWRDRR
jgi:hypothetical protein